MKKNITIFFQGICNYSKMSLPDIYIVQQEIVIVARSNIFKQFNVQIQDKVFSWNNNNGLQVKLLSLNYI